MRELLYTDSCCASLETKIKEELNLEIVKRMEDSSWNIPDSSRILTDPQITLAIFNTVDEIALMEVGILIFMCKHILITDRVALEYPALIKQVSFIELACNLKDPNSNFISWYKFTRKL